MDGRGLLRETAVLIGSGWCCGAGARDGHGHAVRVSDPRATAWSLCGALAAVSERPDFDGKSLRDALWGISGVIPDSSLDGWNDRSGRTQTDILEMLDHAQSNLDEQPPPRTEWSLDGG